MIDVTIEAPIPPKAYGRAYPVMRPGSARPIMVKPSRDRTWQRSLARCVRAKMGRVRLEGPVRVDILAVISRPTRLRRGSDPPGLIWAPVKPDADNIRKNVLDALRMVWHDDAQVCDGRTLKVYSERDRSARTVVRIRTITWDADAAALWFFTEVLGTVSSSATPPLATGRTLGGEESDG